MKLLNDNDLCLVSGGKRQDEYRSQLKSVAKSQDECKQSLGSAVKEFFWDACGILAETTKWFGAFVLFVNSWSYAVKDEAIMPDYLKDLMGKTNKK